MPAGLRELSRAGRHENHGAEYARIGGPYFHWHRVAPPVYLRGVPHGVAHFPEPKPQLPGMTAGAEAEFPPVAGSTNPAKPGLADVITGAK
jgi:hypothetical protein